MSLKRPPLAGFLRQAESLYVPNLIISAQHAENLRRIIGIVPVFWRIDAETWFDCTARPGCN